MWLSPRVPQSQSRDRGKGAFGGSLFPTHRLFVSAPWARAQVPVTDSPSLWLLALLGRARPLVDIPPYEPCQQRAAVATKKQGLRSQPFWVSSVLICKREIPGPASLETALRVPHAGVHSCFLRWPWAKPLLLSRLSLPMCSKGSWLTAPG